MYVYSIKSNKKEKGFSYIEVMIALVILLVGILQMASALAANLLRSYETEKRIISKQVALSTIESIMSARDIARVGSIEGWDSIGNVGSNPVNGTPRGTFLTGWCPIRADLGADGVAGTADDACPENSPCVVGSGPTNNSTVLKGYQRQIVITDIADPERPTPPNPISRRRIDVKIKYFVNSLSRTETISTIITNY
jgi:prepilin-type N-terminal cleavage/methylation domain-containing protein